ncbi:MAG: FtsX-like permease family protein, partial [Burkholderiales bacterium]
LSRSAARRRELAIKVALGASRALLIRQVLMETLLITLGSAVLGLLFASWTAHTLPAFFAPEEASMLDIGLDARIVGATVLFSCIAGLLFAVGPSRHAASTPDADVLRSDNATVGEAPSGARLRRAVVIGQVALSTLMLIASGLLVRVLASALDGGFGPGGRGVAIAMVKMPGADAGDALRGLLFYRRALEAARTIPGAEAVAWAMTLPVGRATVQRFHVPAGAGSTESMELEVNVASPDYFRTLRIPVIDGRPFTPEDGALTKPVVIVNDVLARRHFRTRAVGSALVDREGTAYEIVGVVRTGRYRTFQEAAEPMVYFPLAQSDPTYMHLVVRTAGDPRPALPVLAKILRASDEGADVRWTMTFDDHLREALSLDRLTTTVVVACALAALALATMGVYGVMSDVVRRRTSEIGLRVALGAGTLQVITLVFGEGLHLTVTGAIAGVVSALLLGRVGRSLVDGLPQFDPVSLTAVPLVMILVVIGAAVLPALRALRISPTVALRAE